MSGATTSRKKNSCDVVEIGAAVGGALVRRLHPRLPLRSEQKAEEALIGAMLSGVDMPLLDPDDFTVPLYRQAVIAANVLIETKNHISPEFIVALLWKAEWIAEPSDALVELHELKECFSLSGDLKENTRLLKEAARARRMSLFLRSLDEDLCLGRVTPGQAIERLRKASK
jgi:hypothetical protein